MVEWKCITRFFKIVGNVAVSEKGDIMQNDKKIENNPEVCTKIFDQVDKPENYHMCKALNVYDDRYRVNVYVREDVEDLTGHKLYIKDSYFCKLDNDTVTILS